MAGDVELQDVTKAFGEFRAVDAVSLAIRAGDFVALLGPSGAGKSTVLRMIGGFELPDGGSIRIGGRDVTDLPPYRRDVNTVFQNYALFPHMSVAENVAYGLRQDHVPRRERQNRVREALEMVQMLPLAQREPTQLSGGQQQRVALARALVKRPSVLLLDEPLGALDRKLRQQMQVELKLLQQELGTTFIFVTHDQEEALAMSDVIAVMRNGRVEQVGTPTELYDRPRTPFVAGFIGAQNFFPGRIDGAGGRLTAEAGMLIEAARCAGDLSPGSRGLAAVRPEHIGVSRLEPDSRTNSAEGQVVAIVMLGDSQEYIVRLANGQEVFSRAPRTAAGAPNDGERVWVSWSRDHATLYPYEELTTGVQAIGRRRSDGARAAS